MTNITMNRYRVKSYSELTHDEFQDLNTERTERWQKAIRENQGTLIGVVFERDMVKIWMTYEPDPWHIPRSTFDKFFTNVRRNHFDKELFTI